MDSREIKDERSKEPCRHASNTMLVFTDFTLK